MPIVLVQNPVKVNEDYDWKDIVGKQHHFPNQYKNRCIPGTPFVYYRGTRRADRKRAIPEYFGCGTIGEVWRDDSIPETSPKKDWAWYCDIEDYVVFPVPVPWKVDGETLERIAQNHWSVGVRPLPQDVYDKIIQLAGVVRPAEEEIPLPDPATVIVTETDHELLIPRKPVTPGRAGELRANRYSRNALRVGRRAEDLAFRYLTENATALGARNIRWVAKEGLTPGWDIQYENAAGQKVAVEVKGSVASGFTSVDITVGEWNAALELRERYWLFLVADCFSTHPRIERIQNPASRLDDGKAQLLPVVFRFSALQSPQESGS